MKIQETVRRETLRIAVGTVILSSVMLAVFALLKKLDYSVALGALLGSATAVGNFLLLGLSVQSAAQIARTMPKPPPLPEEEGEDPDDELRDAPPAPRAEDTPEMKQIRRKMQTSYGLRMLLIGLVCILAAVLPCFNLIASALPLLFPQLIIHTRSLVQGARKKV